MATEESFMRQRIDPVEFILNLDPDEFQSELFQRRISLDPSWETTRKGNGDVKDLEGVVMEKLGELQDMVASMRPRPQEGTAYKELVLGDRGVAEALVIDSEGVVCFAVSAPRTDPNLEIERFEQLVNEGGHEFETVRVVNSNDFTNNELDAMIENNSIQNLEICGGTNLAHKVVNAT